ncbi:hypothetical protein BJY04DRAFT_202069 [Aspergillus karnatakaensis]|uniref:uncharacterized protein n=1 Tax=Aspergillus karnatakaensis TaxID=1810916 RepID=UPI003CCE3834
MPRPIAFVTGATGHQGGATARELLQAGIKVHVLVRNPSSESATELQRLGARLFPGDFDNLPALKAATTGATAVFLNVTPTPSNPEQEVIHAKNILEAATAAGTVTTLVYSSVTMTTKHESFPNWSPEYPLAWYWQNKAQIESLVQQANVQSWTILRPAFLMHNYHRPMASFMFPELGQRVFRSAYKPTTAMTVLDQGDVGKFAAAAIVDPVAYNGHIIDLGVEALTAAEIVGELTLVSGCDIALEWYPEDEAAQLAQTNPVIRAQLWANEVGYQVDFAGLSKYPIRLTTFREYLEKHREQVVQTVV